jgi:branched-chain amino acid transport system permease protein
VKAAARRILSGDPPGNVPLSLLMLALVAGLLLLPVVLPGTRSLDVGARIAVFALLAASYDVLLGYTGIVSFGHVMFFGIGSYGVGIAMTRLGPSWEALGLGCAMAAFTSVAIAFGMGMLSLRIRAIFFAMITLAVASFVQILTSQFSEYTGGDDGLNFRVPDLLRPGTEVFVSEALGIRLTGRVFTYYVVVLAAVLLFLLLLRLVNSPFGRVLQCIRENEFRAEALGYRTVVYRTLASCIAALFATLAGVLFALWLRYTGPDATLSLHLMIDLLLMVVIGGMGTMYGAALGAALFVLSQNYLQDLLGVASAAVQGVPLLPSLLHPDRWLLWLGALFIVCVYYFPMGVFGSLRGRGR